MSKVEELEKKIAQAKRQVLKEKYSLEDELEQLKQDKFSYKRKGDFAALEKANLKEKEIKSKLNSLKNRVPSLEVQLKKAKEDQLRQKTRVENKRRQIEKQNTTKKQMNSILRLMRQGKTRSQAAQSVGIPLSRVSHWVLEGKRGVSSYTHFYHEVISIEEDRERRKREEINRQNRIREQERQRRLREERQKRENERKQREERQKLKENKIKNQMNSIISQMQNGKSRIQAASYAGVSSRDVNEWFIKGWKRKGEPYNSFYIKVNTIETRNKRNESKNVANSANTISLTKMVTCPKCGNKYNKSYYSECPNCKKSKFNTAGEKSNKYIKCSKCGKWYSGDKTNCPHCNRKSTSIAKVNYCQNCGKKITNSDLNYCSNCGKKIKDDTKVHKKKTTVSSTPSNDSSDDWIKCCIGAFVIFMIIGLIMTIL
ncbi:MAG: hypothetical protein IJ104_04530 [Methanobrevibacter sp.]|nr:hypothetical protein [Methanobrevibacter sp.]